MAGTKTVFIPSSSTVTTIVEVNPDSIAQDSPYRIVNRLLLLRSEYNGEVWVTWLPEEVAEHGVGATTRDAVANLWDSLCKYLDSLEESEGHLSPKLNTTLNTLRKYIKHR